MTTITIEVPDELLAKVAQQERSIQEVVIDLLEDAFDKNDRPVLPQSSTREDTLRELTSMGLIRAPGAWDSTAAKEWRSLPPAERQQHLRERKAMRFSGSPGATAVTEGRR